MMSVVMLSELSAMSDFNFLFFIYVHFLNVYLEQVLHK